MASFNQSLPTPAQQPTASTSNPGLQPQPSNTHMNLASTFKIPGTFVPEWLEDSFSQSCMLCDERFTLIRRRHHCRSCGKLFCSQCCNCKAKLLYLNNEEARVCLHCAQLLELMLPTGEPSLPNQQTDGQQTAQSSHTLQSNATLVLPSNNTTIPVSSSSNNLNQSTSSSHQTSVLKSNTDHQRLNSSTSKRLGRNPADSSSSSSQQSTLNKRVSFPDGIRPGTDLTDQPSQTSSVSLPRKQPTSSISTSLYKKLRIGKSSSSLKYGTIIVFDEIGFLPPLVKTRSSKSKTDFQKISSATESKMIGFKEIADALSDDGTLTFVLLNDLNLKVKIIHMKDCSPDPQECSTDSEESKENLIACWCFLSEGLRRFNQKELLFVLVKEQGENCIPRDVFQIYLMTHELALRGQSLHNLGSLVFEHGLFEDRLLAGVLFVDPTNIDSLKEVITAPPNSYLACLLIQRSEIPWAKIFPMRLYYRFGHQYKTYPCSFVNYRNRAPLYYEIGHSIISILGDFRNYRYSVTHIQEMRVCYSRKERKVFVHFPKLAYKDINKVLDKSSNEHVLAWSSGFMHDSHGYLVALQNEDGDYESVEFLKKNGTLSVLTNDNSQPVKNSLKEDDDNMIIGTTFVIFSGAMKANQSGQTAKISIVEDGLLIQILSCTMSALKNSIHFMDSFHIDCGETNDALDQVFIDWSDDDEAIE